MNGCDMNGTVAQVMLLGTGAACGVPTYYCGCKACEEAKADPRARRTCSSMLVTRNERTLIDCAPEMHLQLDRFGIPEIDRVIFTHEHFDHVGGVPQLEYLVRLKTRKAIDFYCNSQTAEYISTHFEKMADTYRLHVIEAGQRLEFDGIGYTPLLATHCPGAFGYLIELPADAAPSGNPMKVAYFPDTARPCDETLELLRGIDVLVIDATFNGANWMAASHMSIDSSAALAAELGVSKAVLTHMSMHFDTPITLAEVEERLAGTNVFASYDGFQVI